MLFPMSETILTWRRSSESYHNNISPVGFRPHGNSARREPPGVGASVDRCVRAPEGVAIPLLPESDQERKAMYSHDTNKTAS